MLLVLACAPAPVVETGDLTPTALWVETELAAGRVPELSRLPSGPPPPFSPPSTIRVWRRSLGGNNSCTGQVDVIDFDTYVKHVVPHEWYASWHDESLRAGAIAVRSYSAWWVNAGGKYDCADVDDTSATQNYGDTTHPNSDAAVDHTAGIYAVDGEGQVVFAEYSAENGDPTKYDVSDPLCAGEALYGHGRGLCQWGSQRWATQEGKTFPWIIEHYYPGAGLLYPRAAMATGPDPLELVEGDSATVDLVFVNNGSLTWTADTRVETWPKGTASAMADASWSAENHPANLSGSVALDGTATVSFVVTAPGVDQDTDIAQSFTLWTDGAWVDEGALAVVELRVLDAGSVDSDAPADSDPRVSNRMPGTRTELTSSCSHLPGGWALASLLLLGTRTRR